MASRSPSLFTSAKLTTPILAILKHAKLFYVSVLLVTSGGQKQHDVNGFAIVSTTMSQRTLDMEFIGRVSLESWEGKTS